MKTRQDLSEVQRAAEAARESDRLRTEHERQIEHAHEAMMNESKRIHFLEHGLCP